MADGKYDCCELFEYYYNTNITPIVKTKEFNRITKLIRLGKSLNSFNKDIYHLRGLVESIFGVLKTKNRLKLDDKLVYGRCRNT